jgi:hypothetical protein
MSDRKFENREWKFENNNWALGVALILVGGLFLLNTFDVLNINLMNWWAIFILIPGLNMTVNGWRRYQADQSSSSRNTAFWGLMLIILAFSFFFNIAWSLVFPLGLIGVGVYLFFLK